MLGTNLILALATIAGIFTQTAIAQATPKPPGLTYLYSSNVTLGTTINYGAGPKGNRVAIPITGGVFTGPKMKGKSPFLEPFLTFFKFHSRPKTK